jgi:hypothetical protein
MNRVLLFCQCINSGSKCEREVTCDLRYEAKSRCADHEGRQLTSVAESLLRKETIWLESGKVGQGWHSLPW